MLFDGHWRFQVLSLDPVSTYTLTVPSSEQDYAKFHDTAELDNATHTFTPKEGYTFFAVKCHVKNGQKSTEQIDGYFNDPKTALTDDKENSYPPIAYDMVVERPLDHTGTAAGFGRGPDPAVRRADRHHPEGPGLHAQELFGPRRAQRPRLPRPEGVTSAGVTSSGVTSSGDPSAQPAERSGSKKGRRRDADGPFLSVLALLYSTSPRRRRPTVSTRFSRRMARESRRTAAGSPWPSRMA